MFAKCREFQSVNSNEKLKRKSTKRNSKNVQIKFSFRIFKVSVPMKNWKEKLRKGIWRMYKSNLLYATSTKTGKMLSCWSHFSTRYTSWHAFSPEQHHSTTLFYLVVLLLVKTKSDIMRLYQRSLLTQFHCSGRYYLQTCVLSWIGWGNLVFFSFWYGN